MGLNQDSAFCLLPSFLSFSVLAMVDVMDYSIDMFFQCTLKKHVVSFLGDYTGARKDLLYRYSHMLSPYNSWPSLI